ncbi:sugar ABC transporter permease, partial [Streptomyces sp. NPDC051453]
MSTFASTAPAAKTSGSSAAPARARSGTRRGLLRWFFVAPALAYMALFFGYPLIRNIVMSFQHYTPKTYFTGEAPFNGLDNWRAVFADELFAGSLWHTALFTL